MHWFPQLARALTSEKVTTPSSITEGRITLAAALAQAPYSSSLAASADRSGEALKALC